MSYSLNEFDKISAQWEQVLVSNMRNLLASCEPVRGRERMNEQLRELYSAMRSYREEVLKDGGKEPTLDKNGLPVNITTPIPTALANANDLAAYLIGVYAIRNPILQVPDLPNAMHITNAVKDALAIDSREGNWAAEMIKIIYNAVYLDNGPAELRVTSSGRNKLRALCPFNTFVDPDIPLDKVPSEGRFAGYMERTNIANLWQMLSDIPGKENYLASWGQRILDNPLDVAEVYNLMDTGNGAVHYEVPRFRVCPDTHGGNASIEPTTGTVDWGRFGLEDQVDKVEAKLRVANTPLYITIVYSRARRDWLGLPSKYQISDSTPSSVPSGQKIPIYKLTYLNGAVLLAAEPVTDPHGLLPVMTGTMNLTTSTGDDPYSITEQLIPAQAYSSKLMSARMVSLRRSLDEKALYDKTALKNPEALTNAGSSEKVALELHKAEDGSTDIRRAYLPVPFDASGVSYLLGMLDEGGSLAERIIGNNPQMRGIRNPGNKLQSEAAREASFAEGRFQVYAIIFQQTFMSPFKQMLRTNYAYMPQALKYFDRDEQQFKAVNPDEFRQSQFDFGISDGLMPAHKRVPPELVGQMLTAVQQIPQLAQEFDLRALFILFAKSAGMEDVERIPKPQQPAIPQAPADGQSAPQQQPQGAQQQGPDSQPPPAAT